MNQQDSEGKSLLVKILEVLMAITMYVKQNGCSSMLEDTMSTAYRQQTVFSSWYITKHL